MCDALGKELSLITWFAIGMQDISVISITTTKCYFNKGNGIGLITKVGRYLYANTFCIFSNGCNWFLLLYWYFDFG